MKNELMALAGQAEQLQQRAEKAEGDFALLCASLMGVTPHELTVCLDGDDGQLRPNRSRAELVQRCADLAKLLGVPSEQLQLQPHGCTTLRGWFKALIQRLDTSRQPK